MKITYDPWKRDKTLAERGLDFEDAPHIFVGKHFTKVDDRMDYGEVRYITAGMLNGRMVVMVWTPRGAGRHIISMRRAHGKEIKKIKIYMG